MDPRTGKLRFNRPAPPPPPATRVAGIDIPPSPPPEALGDVDRAAKRYDELAQGHRELHFEMDSDSGRVIVEVRDQEGHVLRTLSPTEALDVISGREL